MGYLVSHSQAEPGNANLEALPRWNKGALLIRGSASGYALPGRAWERETRRKKLNPLLQTYLIW